MFLYNWYSPPPPIFYTSNVPVQLGSDTDWVMVNVGYLYGCAIKQDGSMWCWGNTANDYRYLSRIPGDNWLKVFCDLFTRFAIKTTKLCGHGVMKLPSAQIIFFMVTGK